MTRMMKSLVLSGSLALCALFGCVTPAPESSQSQSQSSQSQSSQSLDEALAPEALPTSCSQFCPQAEGPGWTNTSATSEAQCTSKNGFWFPSGGEFQGPPPGCCCVCPLRPPLACA